MCAHDVTHHGRALDAPSVACGCTAEDVYPPDVLARRKASTRAFEDLFAISGEIGSYAASQSRGHDYPNAEEVRAGYVEVPRFMGRSSVRIANVRRDRVRRFNEAFSNRAVEKLH